MSKYIFFFIAAAVLSSCGGKSRKPEAATATDKTTGQTFAIELSDSLIMHRSADTLDFGRIREGQVVVRDFRVLNSGDKPMVITRMDVSCGCIEAEYPKDPLRPGESGEMAVKLDTRGLGGWIYKTVLMQTSIASKPRILIVIAEIE